MNIETDFESPILFRTVSETVYRSTLKNGSLWLRSNAYYQEIEDKVRVDWMEGVNGSSTNLPLHIENDGIKLELSGPGHTGLILPPHYIMSLHGLAISDTVRSDFGGFTFGIKSIAKLSAEILYRASEKVAVNGYCYGPVAYQYTALCRSHRYDGAAIRIGKELPHSILSADTSYLRKIPVLPFILQDEWRVVIFVSKYLDDDKNAPLKLEVDVDNFFPYIEAPSIR